MRPVQVGPDRLKSVCTVTSLLCVQPVQPGLDTPCPGLRTRRRSQAIYEASAGQGPAALQGEMDRLRALPFNFNLEEGSTAPRGGLS